MGKTPLPRHPKRTASPVPQSFRIPDVDSLEDFLASARQMWCQAHPDKAQTFLEYRVSVESQSRSALFTQRNSDLPVVVGNHLHVWVKAGPSTSDALTLCVTVGIGAQRQDFMQALPNILTWRTRLTAFQGGEDLTGFANVKTMIQGWKQKGATESQIVERLHQEMVALLKGYKNAPSGLGALDLLCLHTLLHTFGINDRETLRICKNALANLRQDLPAFGRPRTTAPKSGRALRFTQHEDFPITTEMVKTFLRHGRKW